MLFHPHDDFKIINDLFLPTIRSYQQLASKHGIGDIFQDNGGKCLQMCLALNLIPSPRRLRHDAVDAAGNLYELKSTNILKTKLVSTSSHLTAAIVTRYREGDFRWIFGVYEGIELKEIYYVGPKPMEHHYNLWEAKLAKVQKPLNCPMIPLTWVKYHGKLVFSTAETLDKYFKT